MNIAVVILWYLIGYAGCIWAVSRKYDVTIGDLLAFLLFGILGPFAPIIFFVSTLDWKEVVIRRRK